MVVSQSAGEEDPYNTPGIDWRTGMPTLHYVFGTVEADVEIGDGTTAHVKFEYNGPNILNEVFQQIKRESKLPDSDVWFVTYIRAELTGVGDPTYKVVLFTPTYTGDQTFTQGTEE